MKIAVIASAEMEYSHPECEIDFFYDTQPVTTDTWAAYEAAFLVMPCSENAICTWTGHPHLRSVQNSDELTAEINFLLENVECEKKLLIAYPDMDALAKHHPYCSEIEQVYLVSDKGTHRIRKRVAGGTVMYVETLKMRTTGMTCFEYENSLTEDQYMQLLHQADKKKHPIRKKRYCFLYEGRYFELDIYDFWRDKAIMELELRDDSMTFRLPPEITLIKDVTDDKRYKNNYLAGVTDYESY